MDKHPKLIGLICLLISAVSVFFVLSSLRQKQDVSQKPSYPPPMAIANQAYSSVVGSPDGKWNLTMKEVKNKEGKTYTFSIVDESNGNSKEIYTKTVSTEATMSIPLNTFSPDDKYVFVKEVGPTDTSYFVMTTTGVEIAKDTQTFEIVSLFAEKHPNYKIIDATGWGGMNLIVFNTDKVSGGIGPSFWFEVPSKSFIQLSNRFN